MILEPGTMILEPGTMILVSGYDDIRFMVRDIRPGQSIQGTRAWSGRGTRELVQEYENMGQGYEGMEGIRSGV